MEMAPQEEYERNFSILKQFGMTEEQRKKLEGSLNINAVIDKHLHKTLRGDSFKDARNQIHVAAKANIGRPGCLLILPFLGPFTLRLCLAVM